MKNKNLPQADGLSFEFTQAFGKNLDDKPEQRLAIAILDRALRDLFSRGRLRSEAHDYFFIRRKEKALFCFENICEILNIDRLNFLQKIEDLQRRGISVLKNKSTSRCRFD